MNIQPLVAFLYPEFCEIIF